MTNQEFKYLYNSVEKANNRNDDIWWCGWAFIGMTERQHKKISDLLKTKGFIDQTMRSGAGGVTFWHRLPSGIEVRRV